MDSAAEKNDAEQEKSYEARYKLMNQGAALMLDYLDQIEQEPSTALARFEQLIAGKENSLAVFALMRNSIAHQVKAEFNGNHFSADFSLARKTFLI